MRIYGSAHIRKSSSVYAHLQNVASVYVRFRKCAFMEVGFRIARIRKSPSINAQLWKFAYVNVHL
jgi:hypothetical protein